MRAVNLLPKDDARRQSRKAPSPPVLVGAIGGVLVCTMMAVLTMSASGSVDAARTELENVKVQLAVTPRPEAGPTQQELSFAGERTQRAAALASALSRRVAWDRVLRRFSLVLPDDVWLTNLTVTAPTLATAAAVAAPAAGAPPGGFFMVGYTYSHEAVARLLSRLAVVPDLANIQLQGSSRSLLAGRDVVSFTIVASIRSGGTPS